MANLKSGIISPAYGRDYRSAAKAKKAFYDGDTFIVHLFNGPQTYCSIRDFAPGAMVEINYNRFSRVTMVNLGA